MADTPKHTLAQSLLLEAQHAPESAIRQIGNAVTGLGAAARYIVPYAMPTSEKMAVNRNIADFGSGLASQAGIGRPQNPQERARKELVANEVERSVIGKYAKQNPNGTWYFDPATTSATLENDPAAVLTDAASVLPMIGGTMRGAGVAADAAKAASVAKALKTAGNITSRTGDVVNPIALATRPAAWAAKHAPRLAGATATGAQALLTGQPARIMRQAYAAGKTGDAGLKGAFLRHNSGLGTMDEIKQTAENAVEKLREKQSNDYLAKRAGLSTAQVDFTPIRKALSDAWQEANYGGDPMAYAHAKSALSDAEALIDNYETNPDPSVRTPFGVDSMKKQLWDIESRYRGNPTAHRLMGNVYHGVRESLVRTDPGYADLMESYQNTRNVIDDLTRASGASASTITTAMSKQLRMLKTPAGEDMFDKLAAEEPTLPYMLAGQSLRSQTATGLSGFGETLAQMALAGHAIHDPLVALPTMATVAVAQSPHAMGKTNFALGDVAGAAERAGQDMSAAIPAPVKAAAHAASHVMPGPAQAGALLAEGQGAANAIPPSTQDINGTVLPDVDNSDGVSVDEAFPTAPEPRPARASGGKVDYAAEAEKLVRAAETARKRHAAETKPLLSAPDETISAALAVANEAAR